MWLTIRPEELDIETRQLDTLFWSSIVGKSSSIRKVLPRRADKVIGGDLFNALYQWNPRLKVVPPDPALAAWLGTTMAQPSFSQLRGKTVGDRNLAAAATVRLYRELMRPRDSTIKAVGNLKQTLDHMEAINQSTALENSLDSDIKSQPLVDAIKKAQEKLGEAIKKEASPLDPLNKGEPSIFAGYTAKKTSDGRITYINSTSPQTSAIDNTIADLDMATSISDFDSRGASLDPNDTSERILDCMTDESIISKVTSSDSLRKIFQVAGRMSIILQRAKSKKPKPAPTPVGVDYGSDISSVLSSELVNLADPELEDIFWMKFLEGGLLQYDHKSVVNEGLGPFVCCVDYSRSMSGQPLEYANGLFVAMARMAVAKRRKIVFIPFAIQAGVPSFIQSGLELIQVLSKSQFNLGGGTRFEPPLNAASNIIANEAIYKHADVLFITDGYSDVSDAWQNAFISRKQKLGFRLIGINIMGNWDKKQLPMFDVVASMGRQGEISKLEWLSEIVDRMV